MSVSNIELREFLALTISLECLIRNLGPHSQTIFSTGIVYEYSIKRDIAEHITKEQYNVTEETITVSIYFE